MGLDAQHCHDEQHGVDLDPAGERQHGATEQVLAPQPEQDSAKTQGKDNRVDLAANGCIEGGPAGKHQQGEQGSLRMLVRGLYDYLRAEEKETYCRARITHQTDMISAIVITDTNSR